MTRSLFQLSRREQEFLSFNFIFQDENENFFLSISSSERRAKLSFFNLRLRDENEIEIKTILARIFENYIILLSIFQKKAVNFLNFLEIICYFFLKRFEYKSHFLRRE